MLYVSYLSIDANKKKGRGRRRGNGRGKKKWQEKGNGTLMVYVQIACDSKIPRREIDGYS
jgi:hypothetical protein